jgi:hypothetical protein
MQVVYFIYISTYTFGNIAPRSAVNYTLLIQFLFYALSVRDFEHMGLPLLADGLHARDRAFTQSYAIYFWISSGRR